MGRRRSEITGFEPVAGLFGLRIALVRSLSGCRLRFLSKSQTIGLLFVILLSVLSLTFFLLLKDRPRLLLNRSDIHVRSAPNNYVESRLADTDIKDVVHPESTSPAIDDRIAVCSETTVLGKLVDASTKQPIVDAQIILMTKYPDNKEKNQRYRSQPDETGSFCISRVQFPSKALLEIRSPSYEERFLPLYLPIDDSYDVGAISLTPLWRIHGCVVDEKRRVIAGAKVTACFSTLSLGNGLGSTNNTYNASIETFTGSDGKFEFNSTAMGKRIPQYIYIEAESYATARKRATLKDETVFVLRRAKTISGRIFWSLNDTPVVGAVIDCDPIDAPAQDFWKTTRTETDGSFFLDAIPEEDVRINCYINKPRPLDRSLAFEKSVSVSIDECEAGVIYFEGPTSLAVRVEEAGTLLPICDAKISYETRSCNIGEMSTDSNGEAIITGLPADQEIFIGCFSEPHLFEYNKPIVVLTGRAGTTASLVLELKRDPQYVADIPVVNFYGHVKKRNGEPVKGAMVTVYVSSSANNVIQDVNANESAISNALPANYRMSDITDVTGEYSFFLKMLPNLQRLDKVSVSHHDYQISSFDLAHLGCDDYAGHTLYVDPIDSWVEGVVCSSAGDPVPEANVRCFYEIVQGFSQGDIFECIRKTDDSGRFFVPFRSDTQLSCFAAYDGTCSDYVKRNPSEIAAHLDKPLLITLDVEQHGWNIKEIRVLAGTARRGGSWTIPASPELLHSRLRTLSSTFNDAHYDQSRVDSRFRAFEISTSQRRARLVFVPPAESSSGVRTSWFDPGRLRGRYAATDSGSHAEVQFEMQI